MSVIAQDLTQLFAGQLLQKVKVCLAENAHCGVILAPCRSAKAAEQLQFYLQRFDAELQVQWMYDEPLRIVCLLLETRKLADTHYLSLAVKEYMDLRGMREGRILVASFPQSGEASMHTMSNLTLAAAQHQGEAKEISLFLQKDETVGISSILIADTEEVCREFIKLKLELKGYRVHVAKDGSEALEKWSEFSPDLLITELHLPVLDGYQVIQRVKEDERNEGKVIVLTEKQLDKDVNRAFELGANDYVTKPFSYSELEWRIKKLQFS